jgi:predicted SAM-dependent methyltransferase
MSHSLIPNLKSKRLHLGCGLVAPENWLNVDGSPQAWLARKPLIKSILKQTGVSFAQNQWPSNILYLNLDRPLRFQDNHFEAVYASHLLEHLYRDQAMQLVTECQRILAPGGIIRLVVPDLETLSRQYLESANEAKGNEMPADRFMRRLMTHSASRPNGLLGIYRQMTSFHDHKWMYDSPSLVSLLEECGFMEVTAMKCHQSNIPDIKVIEKPERIENGEGIAVEGIKAATN